VLEAIILALILLGAAYSVTTLRTESVDQGRPRAHLERVARDSMTVLSGLEDANGSLLDAYLQEAMHCVADPDPSPVSCQGTRSANLSLKVSVYLPAGAGYAIALDNGVEAEDLYRSVLPPGETVSATFTYAPRWNLTFLAPELSCYDAGMAANVTAIPIRRGALATLTALKLDAASGKNATAVAAQTPGFWNASFAAADVPALGVLRANATGRGGTFLGAVSVPSSALGGLGPSLVTALRGARLTPSASTIAVGGRVSFATDLAPLLALQGVSLLASNVTVYDPVPPRSMVPDTYLPAAVLARNATGGATWDVPAHARLGVHPVLLRASLLLPNGNRVEVHRVDAVTVSLPDGTVPIDPPYRAVLQVWFSDWR
jgi:hypothetical protein